MRALALTMKDQEVIILMNHLAAAYDKLADKAAARGKRGKFRMKEKPRKIRAGLSRRGCLWGGRGLPV
jgi:hypothetical protein